MKKLLMFVILLTANFAFSQTSNTVKLKEVSGVKTAEVDDTQKICLCCNKNTATKALIVLDGKIISDEEFKRLKPESIASVDVYKDKKATELYGDRGKDGVIIINSK